MQNFGYSYKRKELGDVSMLLPLVLLAAILGGGGYMIYRRDAKNDEYEYEDEDEEEPTSGKKSIKALDKAISRLRANPDLLG
jgi:hypothetical protein